jgi:hypothetical protein
MDSLFGKKDEPKSLTLFSDLPETSSRSDHRPQAISGKGFTSQLDAFLAEAFDTIAVETESSNPRSKRGGSGLDLLIRRTGEQTTIEENNSRRRITLVLDKPQLDKLKVIAQSEGVRLKDLLNELVEKYLTTYAGKRKKR